MDRMYISRDHENFPEDITRIVRAFAGTGATITRHEAEDAWCRYSDSLCAGWLMLDGYTDEAIVACCEEYLR